MKIQYILLMNKLCKIILYFDFGTTSISTFYKKKKKKIKNIFLKILKDIEFLIINTSNIRHSYL